MLTMISSVPVTIGEEIFSLQFIPGDVWEIERTFDFQEPLAFMLTRKRLLVTSIAGVMLWHGLKVKNEKGELVRAIPLTAAGKERALTLVNTYLRGKDVMASVELSNLILEGFENAEWYNLKETKSNPKPVEEVEPPKNLQQPGSRRTRK
jgi:hypothetical protein